MSGLETIGVTVIAPALSTLTAGLVAYSARTFISLQKVQKNLLYRVEQNEQEIQNVREDIQEIKGLVS